VDDTPLVVIESPYRALIPPLLRYIGEVEKRAPGRAMTVVLAEFVPRHFWEHVLHNQTALRLKLQLFARPNTVVIDVPFHLGADGREEIDEPVRPQEPVSDAEAGRTPAGG
jgi:hypothetical protein